MIEASHLTRQYGRTTAVSNVSFSIGRNEVVGLLGPNGAGKTTIMRMLSGYLEPSTGTVTVNGENLGQNAYALQRQLGYLPENLPVYPDMIVADYLDYVAAIKGIEPRERLRAVKDALLSTQMQDRALHQIGKLSRGMKQRVGVAQALIGKPRLLILDEPTNGLDPHQTEQMRQLITALSRRATIILSTHIMQEVEAVCERVLILSNGQLAMDTLLADLQGCGHLLLRTDTRVSDLHKQLLHMPQVAEAEPLPNNADTALYCLTLHPGTDPDTAAANIAHCVDQAGARLYQLERQVRHLDDVFQEVVDSGP
jgi:gliding motility-associated transport system ATP-binding protein